MALVYHTLELLCECAERNICTVIHISLDRDDVDGCEKLRTTIKNDLLERTGRDSFRIPHVQQHIALQQLIKKLDPSVPLAVLYQRRVGTFIICPSANLSQSCIY
jgi:hypothetical protein